MEKTMEEAMEKAMKKAMEEVMEEAMEKAMKKAYCVRLDLIRKWFHWSHNCQLNLKVYLALYSSKIIEMHYLRIQLDD